MSEYHAPLRDMRFVLQHLAGIDEIAQLPQCGDANMELVDQILDESARFANEVLSPLNRVGDEQGATLKGDEVETPTGFKEAYRQFIEAGWNGLQFPSEFGGQGLPKIVATPVMEMWKSANMAFSLCPMLSAGAAEALLLCGTEAQQETYIPKLAEGTWTGTMNLTEPQAGSDLAQIKTRAVPEGSHYRVFGQKIFITYGEHDMAENIVHLVLARLPDAPAGVKGISMFIVPKFLLREDGSLGERNDVRCISLEHKLGIHASPTAVMVYGEKDGAIGYLVGQANRGLEYMFVMMNAARFAVGMEGVSIAERAYQQAVAYARDRVQGRDLQSGAQVPIIAHPDVRRMLMRMKTLTEAMRALAYVVAASIDRAEHHPDEAVRKQQQAFVDLMIPVVKGWSTETAIDVASTGVQVHGGMGYIEETGAAQHLRDARITTIYEGTTAIQANDLIGRKILRDGGVAARALMDEIRSVAEALGVDNDMRQALVEAVEAYEKSVHWILDVNQRDPKLAYAASVPFLQLMGVLCGGWQMARAHLAAEKLDAADAFVQAKHISAEFYAATFLTQVPAMAAAMQQAAASTLKLDEAQF
ncbi:MAG TPA: acyl-CoA dehydrogenase [Burkholderiales bacterium]|nr:acyl-CoA dehydrogenase [Burkholderiales bacterium]